MSYDKVNIAYIVDEGWDDVQCGVSTFIRNILSLGKDPDIDLLLVSYDLSNRSDDTSVKDPGLYCEDVQSKQSKESSFKLVLGYLVDLLREVRLFWGKRSLLSKRIILTNQFGCETIPIALRLVCPFSKIIAIVHTHPGLDDNARNPVRSFIEHLCYWATSDLIYNSYSVQNEWGKKLRVDNLGGRVIWYGINKPELTLPKDYPHRETENEIHFVCVARFARWKGHQQLLDVWKEFISKADKDISPKLILVGDGERYDWCKEKVRSCGIEPSVVFLGNKPDGAQYFEGGDVCVLLSNEPEAFGLVLLEAMSREKAVIASRIGGISEVVDDGRTGILVDVGDIDGTVNAFMQLAENKELRDNMGSRGYERWNTMFRSERMMEDYKNYFRRFACQKN